MPGPGADASDSVYIPAEKVEKFEKSTPFEGGRLFVFGGLRPGIRFERDTSVLEYAPGDSQARAHGAVAGLS